MDESVRVVVMRVNAATIWFCLFSTLPPRAISSRPKTNKLTVSHSLPLAVSSARVYELVVHQYRLLCSLFLVFHFCFSTVHEILARWLDEAEWPRLLKRIY